MRRHSRRRAFVLLGVVGFLLLGVGANGSANAQSGADLADQFGGFKLSARGNGFLLSFDSPNLLPVGSPLFSVGLPEAQATSSNGPSGYALASLAYPGAIIADLPTVIAQGAPGFPELPSYPIRQQSFFPAGPTDTSQDIATASMHAFTSEISSDGVARYSASDVQSFFAMGDNTVAAHTGLEDGQVVSRIRSEVKNVNILGILTIESVVTDMVANSNGADAGTDGVTTATGVKFLGLDATLDGEGLHLGPAAGTQPAPAPGPLDPILGGLGLGQLNDALKPVATAVSQLVIATVGANGTVNDLLKDAGISVKVLSPLETKSGAQAQRTANGVLVEIIYNGKTAPLVSTLLAAVPSDQLPADSAIPQIPLNTSPQALFNLLKETFITDLALAPGDVAVQASPPFVFSPTTKSTGSTGTSGSTGGGGGGGTTGFNTAAPRLGTSGTPGTSGSGSLGDALPISLTGSPYAVALALALLLLTGGLSFVGTSRLADNTLAAASSSCPEGLEPPSATYSPGGDQW